MVGLLLDECMSPRLPPRFIECGIQAIHIRDRGMLGLQDHTIWGYAQEQELAFCTINGCDFRKFARRGPHRGLVVIPSGGNAESQFKWTAQGILQALRSNSGTGLVNRYIEVDQTGTIASSEYYDLTRLN